MIIAFIVRGTDDTPEVLLHKSKLDDVFFVLYECIDDEDMLIKSFAYELLHLVLLKLEGSKVDNQIIDFVFGCVVDHFSEHKEVL